MRITSEYLLSLALVVFLLPAAAGMVAQDPVANPETPPKETEANPVETEFTSPRDTLSIFLEAVSTGDYRRAASCLDLEFLDKETRSTKQKSFCDKLYVLLTDAWEVDAQASPSVGIGKVFPLDSTIGVVDSPDAAEDAAKIELAKNSRGEWLFSSASIKLVDEELYDKWVGQSGEISSSVVNMSFPMWLESQIPAEWKQKSFLIKDYQWVALLFLMLIGLAVDILARYFLNFLTNSWFRYVESDDKYKARKNLWKPVGLLLNALTWYFGAKLIDLPASFLVILLVGLKLFAVFASIWTAFSAINVLGEYLLRKAEKTENRYDDLLVPFIKNGLKIVAICVGLVLFVDVFSLNWNSLLGGFGLGGVAIAIASKDVLGNVFGSLTVLTDRPFEIGDWVITEGIEGEVESVGVRSSRIRTFYNSLVVVPNSRLTTAIVDNMGRRKFRRVKSVLGVEYGTSPDQLQAFCEGVRELIRQNPLTRHDYFHVYVNEFGDSAIEILLYFFLRTPTWAGELQEKHNILINIMKLAKELEIEFAYPTQTLHVFQGEPGRNGLQQIEAPKDLGRKKALEIASG
ncbi:MAG: mechanosensitive ion channel family protein, partial [Planctomycetota bacterium]|nr:mechanosensitive ion channel family protein [Planctomycetota bacterium]